MNHRTAGILSDVQRDQGPFSVTIDALDGDAKQLECTTIVRMVPGKRIVCSASWQGRRAFAKFYFGKHADRYWQRELTGLHGLQAGRIPCPRILHQGMVNDGHGYLVLLEALPAGFSFADLWQRAVTDDGRKKYLHRLMELIALQHRQGLEHRDPHFDNFLWAENRIYSLDGGNVLVVRGALSPARSLKNLGLVLAQLESRHDFLIKDAFAHYCNQRGWKTGGIYQTGLLAWVSIHRYKRRKRYLKKIFRESTEFVYSRHHHRVIVFKRSHESPALGRLLADPDSSLHGQDAKLLKGGNTCTVWSVPIDNRTLVIKRYNLKDRAHAVNRALRRTRAAISWKNAHRLLLAGINTATPVALVEERRGSLRGRAYYIAEHIAGPDCVLRMRDAQKRSGETEKVAGKIASLLAELAALKISHGDMKAGNILFQNDEPVLMDLDALRQHTFHPLFLHRHRRDLRRLLRNWDDQPEIQAQMRAALENAGLPVNRL